MRKPIIAGNWKMHKTVGEAISFVDSLVQQLQGWSDTEVVVAPPFVSLVPVAERLKGSGIGLAAQDCFWEDVGAYTGEVSVPMLREAGCRYVIVGHSERRGYFGETDAMVNKKALAVLRHELSPIVCVGETLAQREGGETFTVVARQVQEGLKGIGAEVIDRVVIAYEPVWAIGTGRTATPQQAQEVHAYIRGIVAEARGPAAGERVRIQYGGSVKPENIAQLMAQPDIDGALVGGASLEVSSFVRIARCGR